MKLGDQDFTKATLAPYGPDDKKAVLGVFLKEPLAIVCYCANLKFMPTAKSRRRSVKSAAIRMIRALPDSSSWDDVMYRIYVRQKIETGKVDLRDGRVYTHASIRKEFGVS